MPGANARAMEKAKNLACDSIIFDLEDAVSPDSKSHARDQVETAIQSGGYGYRELIVRCNSLQTAWGKSDVERFASADIAALLFPKIESSNEVEEILRVVDGAGGSTVPIWLMIETPRGVLDLRSFADHPRVEVLVMGTSDLVKELRAEHTEDRNNLALALQQCVLCARLLGKDILDGVHLDFKNEASLREVCVGGRNMGFDGKTLIHPSQIEIANEVFGYSDDDIAEAHSILEVWQSALASGKGVAVLDGKLIENLHAAAAERVISFADAIKERG
ncbi:MAG: CoA ester lyase [Pseudomonadales bacterium]|nr:CoA ester lyase [Pseudomonadales bacterium]